MTGLPLLTSSRLRTFRDCARKHQLQYVEGWRPAKEPEYFRVGTLLHLGLEAWWKAPDDLEGIDGALDAALAAVHGKAADPFEQARVETMLRGYHAAWASDRPRYEVLAVECEFTAPLLNPQTWRPSQTWQLAGKIDAIVRRHADGQVLVIEHKSASEDVQGEDSNYWTKLAIDPQVSAYVLGAEALGYKVDEILYDVLVKPRQRQLLATPVEARKYRADGALYANQREHDETPEAYRERIENVVMNDLGRFFVRRPIPRAASQLEEFLSDAWAQGGAMRDAEKLGRAPKNPEACARYGMCPWWLLCSTGARPEEYPAEFARSENVNPELSEVSK